MAARTLMIQGTGSHVGKSVLVAALCRVYRRRGVNVAPFKAQNMSNNSFVTPDGKEIGRAQAVQAAACRLAMRTDFNPVLIKPEGDRRSQLVVNGEVSGHLTAKDFGRVRRECFSSVREAFARLSHEFEMVILEGAGSPAEINLREKDIVNMRMAREAKAPVLLVADIDRGGAFAALVGTVTLLTPEERRHVKGFLINKFRGEVDLLTPGVNTVAEMMGIRCLGVVPHWGDLQVPQEDSVGWDGWLSVKQDRQDRLTIGVADVPCLSNFTDFESLRREPDAQLVRLTEGTDQPLDALIFPGTKNTVEALRFVKARGLDRMAGRVLARGGMVVGLCGGFQLLGRRILDPEGIESKTAEMEGLGVLDVETSFASKKITVGVTGVHLETGCPVEGYEVHMGRTGLGTDAVPFLEVRTKGETEKRMEGAVSRDRRVVGTYVHGLFDAPSFRRLWLNRLRDARGWAPLEPTPEASLDVELDRLADFAAQHIDLAAVDAIVEQGVETVTGNE